MFLRFAVALGLFSGSLHAAEKLPATYIPIPLVRQQTDYSCGAASSAAVLKYWGLFSGEETDLHADLQTHPKEGTAPSSIVSVLENYGLQVDYEENFTVSRLSRALKAGKSVILDLQAWRSDDKTAWADLWEDGHYVVAVALDAKRLYVMDPSTDDYYAYVPLKELHDRWHDYESIDGKMVKNYQAVILAKGKRPGKTFRAPKQVKYMP
jgi:uncharacterized protein